MLETKTIGYSALFAIIGALIMLGGVKLTDSNAYFCNASKIVINCDKLSAYYGLDNGKCYNTAGNKLCKDGWLKIEQEITVEKEVIKEVVIYKDTYESGVNQWLCSPENCIPKQ